MSKAKRRKRRQRPSQAASPPPTLSPASSPSNRAKIAAERGTPYAWRRYQGPADPYWRTMTFRGYALAQLHPLDELVDVVDGHRVCYLIDLWPHRWPALVEAAEATRGTVHV